MSPISVGAGPQSVAVADVNNDGKPDLIAANSASNNISILLAQSSGTGYAAAPGSPVASGGVTPRSVAVADFNRDGKPDLAIVNSGSNSLSVMLGNGSGGFTLVPGSPFAVGLSPVFVAAGDFNGDGKPDLAVVNSADSTITVLLGDGSGGFSAAAASPVAVATSPVSLAIGDVNGDGSQDLVVANSAVNSVTVLLGNGAGGFTQAVSSPFAVGASPLSVAIGDLNGDGKPDIATANAGGNTVTVLLGDGAGGFSAAPASPVASGSQPAAIAIVDFNNDGIADLVTANGGSNDVTVLQGTGGGAFTPAASSPLLAGGIPAAIAVADLNGDGKPDIAVANSSAGTITLYLNALPALSAKPAAVTLYAETGQAAIAAIPVTVNSSASGSTYTFSTTAPWLIAAPGSNATGTSTAINLAGNAGTLIPGAYTAVARYTAPSFFDAATDVTLNVTNPSGSLIAGAGCPFVTGAGPQSVATADLNGDALPDLVTVNISGNNLSALLGDGTGAFALHGSYAVGTGPVSVAVADFNNDGVPDAATANPGSNDVSVLLGDGSGGFLAAAGSPFAAGTEPLSVAAADINRDGNMDLLIANNGSSDVWVYLGNGTGGFAPAPDGPIAIGSSPESIAVGDFNSDGCPDFAVASSNGKVIAFFGNCRGWFGSPAPFAAGAFPQFVAAGDLNGDGKLDLVTANSGGNNVSVLLGNGAGSFTAAKGGPFAVGQAPQSLTIVDINGDGKPDIVAANAVDNTVSVLLGNGTGAFTAAPGSPFAAGTAPVSIAAADFNRDGRPDLAIANLSANAVSILTGTVAATSGLLTTAAPASVVYGTAVPLTLKVTSTGFSSPTGSATFMDGASALGNAAQSVSPYSFNASMLQGGVHSLNVVYAGDSADDASASNTIAITVTPANQTLTFGPLPGKTFGAAPFNLIATASSGLDAAFASTTASVCTVSGVTVTITSVGTCSILASQPGNNNYNAANPVSQSFNVARGPQTVAFAALPNVQIGSAPFDVSATASSGLAVTFSSTTAIVCTVAGATVTLVKSGSCTIQAAQAGNADFVAASSVSQSFAVTPAVQSITFGPLSDQVFGAAPFALTATASSGLPVSFSSTTAPVCTVSNGDAKLAAVGTCAIQAAQAGNSSFAAATPVTRNFQVTQGSQTIAFGPLADKQWGAKVTVSATASSSLTVAFASLTPLVCTVSGTSVALVGAGMCTVEASQAGNANYAAAAPVDQSFNVTPAAQTITFAAISSKVFGGSPLALTATASSNLPVSFASTTPSNCSVSAGSATFLNAGTCTVEASQAGNGNYSPAMPVDQNISVMPGAQTISFPAIAAQAFGGPDVGLMATASSGLPVTFASTTPSVCTVSGSTATLVASGSCTIQASQSGSANWGAAPNVSQSFKVAPQGQTIDFPPIANQIFGGSPLTLSATATSQLTVVFTSSTASVCTVSGTSLTLVSTGTCTIQAVQAGNSTWGAATPVTQSFMIAPTSQTITFHPIAGTTLGSPPAALSATATSGLAVTFMSTTPMVCTVSGANVTLLSAGNCIIQASQAGNANYAAASPVSQQFAVSPATQTINFGALANKAVGAPAFTLNATASSQLPVTFASLTQTVCTVNGSSVTPIAAGTCTVEASQAGNAKFAAAAAVDQSFTVSPGTQTITFAGIAKTAFSPNPLMLAAMASSGLPVSFASNTTSICTVSGGAATLVALGTCTVEATQAGNANYAAAKAADQSFTITQGMQTISFPAIPAQQLGEPAVTLNATVSSGLPLRFTTSTPAFCTVSQGMMMPVALGSCTVQAAQPGNADYAAASPVTQSFSITKSMPAIGSVLNAGSYASVPVAADGYTVVFGTDLSLATALTPTSALPAALGGTSLAITDSTGNTLAAPLYFVSPSQINFLVPEGLAMGKASMTITNGTGIQTSYPLTIATVSPSLFTADASGKGVPAALVQAYGADGSAQVTPAFKCMGSPVVCVPAPIDLGPAASSVYLTLYGTGIRGRSSLAGVTVTVGSSALQVVYAGAQSTYPGLDQVNVALGRNLLGSGTQTLQLTVDGIAANAVTISIQ